MDDARARAFVRNYKFSRAYVDFRVLAERINAHEQGEFSGRVSLILQQLEWRFGKVSKRNRARVREASIEDLEALGKRLLTAATLKEALGPPD
jgi:hypothetical protein